MENKPLALQPGGRNVSVPEEQREMMYEVDKIVS